MAELELTSIQIERFTFETPKKLTQNLAHRIASELTLAIIQDGKASLVVSGGKTPLALFQYLSQIDIEWEHITISLVDERYVSTNSERSNEKFIHENLLRNFAKKAHFVGLYNRSSTLESAAFIAASRINKLSKPFTVVILGMGEDGHTASFFPGASRLEQALDRKTRALVLPIRSHHALEGRLTMTLPFLISSSFIALHIEGHKKLRVFEKALKNEKNLEYTLPIHAVLKNSFYPVKLYWSPTEDELKNYSAKEPLLTGLFSAPDTKRND